MRAILINGSVPGHPEQVINNQLGKESMKNILFFHLFRIIRGIYHRFFHLMGRVKLNMYRNLYPHIKFGKGINTNGNIYLFLEGNADFGNYIKFNNHTRYNYCGIKAPSSIHVEKGAYLKIGDNTGFSGTSIYCSKRIIIGNNCNFGANSSIWDTNFHPLNSKARIRHDINQITKAEVIIENNVFIGANVLILNGVRIGEGAVIGAGSIVTGNIMPYTINAGIPARKIKDNIE